MPYEFKLPDLGEGVHEGQIIRWLVAEGDAVKEDQPLMEVETDKAAVEIPSPYTGIVTRVHAAEQQIVYVGDVMVTFDDAEVTTGEAQSERAGSASDRTVATTASTKTINGEAASGATVETSQQTRRKPASPAVRRIARQRGLDLESIEGTGPGGRITLEDVERADQGTAPEAEPAEAGAAEQAPPPASTPIVTTTSNRQTTSLTPIAPMMKPITADLDGTPGSDGYGQIITQPITQARKAIAKVMSHSMATIPHVTATDDADVTELDKFRRGYADPQTPGGKITMLAFVIRAVVKALQLHPIFNASFDDDTGEIIYKRYFSIAIGVQTERGLIAPIIRHADRLNISQISDEIMTITENAHASNFAVNDMRGGTFTISNAGAMGGSRYSTPIISPPQVAVLAIGRTRWSPWVVEGELEPRLIMPLSCSFDHRIIDGAQEIAFTRQIIDDLENPARLLL